MNSSNHKFFECIGSMPSHCVHVINRDVIQSFNIFIEFNYMFEFDVFIIQG